MDTHVTERPAHQQRVLTERDELAERLRKLDEFLPGDLFAKLPLAEQARLRRQRTAMAALRDILDERIAAF